jgi:flagellar biosynthesis/type III secretory pathway chaperone
MSSHDETTKLEALTDLLERERKALISGDLEGLARLADEKERLMGVAATMTASGLQALREKATRNQELLNSALEGIRSVAARLDALREARDTLNTYDRSGQRQSIDTQRRPKIERRA